MVSPARDPQVTIDDVARHANVSPATVSRVLNHHTNVSEVLRQRVLDAIQALGYQPDRAARRLRGNASNVIGVIISDIQNPHFTSVVRGIEDTAYARQMNVLLCNADDDPAKQEAYIGVMRAERVAGLIISPCSVKDGDRLLPLQEAGMPVVLIDRLVDQLNFDAVIVDNFHGAYTAVKHLIGLGYRRIAMIAGNLNSTTGFERHRGYQQALADAGIRVPPSCVKTTNFKFEGGYRLANELLAASPAPDAVFVANNLMTLGVLKAIRELELCIPGDIALVGFDDMPWAGELCPPLTTVAQPTYTLGQEAATLLFNRLNQRSAPTRTIMLQTQLVIRESCGAPRHTKGVMPSAG